MNKPHQYHQQKIIVGRLRTFYLNEEEKEMITNLCLDFQDILYLEGDTFSFTNEILWNIRPKLRKFDDYSRNLTDIRKCTNTRRKLKLEKS